MTLFQLHFRLSKRHWYIQSIFQNIPVFSRSYDKNYSSSVNNGFQSEISVADEDFKPKDLELKTIFLTFSHIYILTMAHQYGPILTFVKSERLIWIVLLHFNYIKIS